MALGSARPGLGLAGWPRSAVWLAAAWFGLQAFSFVLHFWVSDARFFWQAPAIIGLYLVGMRLVRRTT